jgi:hypothetical protein
LIFLGATPGIGLALIHIDGNAPAADNKAASFKNERREFFPI